MKGISNFSEIFLHRSPVDGRKGINGLAAIVQADMAQNPLTGALFAFTNKKKDAIRLLYWDRTGFALWMKRLEKEKFRWPLKIDAETVSLSAKELTWLLDGLDIMHTKPHQTLNYSSVS